MKNALVSSVIHIYMHIYPFRKLLERKLKNHFPEHQQAHGSVIINKTFKELNTWPI